MQICQLHIEDGTVRNAPVEVETTEFTFFEDRDSREASRKFLHLEVQWDLSLEDQLSDLSSFTLLPDPDDGNGRTNVLKQDQLSNATNERVDPLSLTHCFIRDKE